MSCSNQLLVICSLQCVIFQNQKRLTQSGRRSPIIKFPQTLSGQQLQSNLHENMIITVIFEGMACDWNNSGANPSRGRRSPWIQRLVPGQMIMTVALVIITVAWVITISTLNMNHELHPHLRNPDFPFSAAQTKNSHFSRVSKRSAKEETLSTS